MNDEDILKKLFSKDQDPANVHFLLHMYRDLKETVEACGARLMVIEPYEEDKFI